MTAKNDDKLQWSFGLFSRDVISYSIFWVCTVSHPCVRLFFRSFLPEPREDLGRARSSKMKHVCQNNVDQTNVDQTNMDQTNMDQTNVDQIRRQMSFAPCGKMMKGKVPCLGRKSRRVRGSTPQDRSSSSSDDWSFEQAEQERGTAEENQDQRLNLVWVLPHTSVDLLSARWLWLWLNRLKF